MTKDVRKEIMHALLNDDKKLKEVKEAVEIAEYNLQVNLDELDEITRDKCKEVIQEIDKGKIWR